MFLFSLELSFTFLPFVGSGLLFAFFCQPSKPLPVIGRRGKCKRWINTDGGNSILGPSSTSSEPSRFGSFYSVLNFTFTRHFHKRTKSFCWGLLASLWGISYWLKVTLAQIPFQRGNQIPDCGDKNTHQHKATVIDQQSKKYQPEKP